jgi:hypothetical protein
MKNLKKTVWILLCAASIALAGEETGDGSLSLF